MPVLNVWKRGPSHQTSLCVVMSQADNSVGLILASSPMFKKGFWESKWWGRAYDPPFDIKTRKFSYYNAKNKVHEIHRTGLSDDLLGWIVYRAVNMEAGASFKTMAVQMCYHIQLTRALLTGQFAQYFIRSSRLLIVFSWICFRLASSEIFRRRTEGIDSRYVGVPILCLLSWPWIMSQAHTDYAVVLTRMWKEGMDYPKDDWLLGIEFIGWSTEWFEDLFN